MKTLTTRLSGQGAKTAMLVLAAGAVLAACAPNEDRITFNGVYYKVKAKAVSKDDRQTFVVSVPRVDRNFEGAVEAGRYYSTLYCIENFGTSDIEWIQGPDGEEGSIPVDNNKITFSGKCITW